MQVRFAKPEEAALIYQFIRDKAEFDRSFGSCSGTVQTTVEKIQTTIFGARPIAYVLLAEADRDQVGFALYYLRYSSFLGQPSIWLDDLFVNPKLRNQGAGTLLMTKLRQVAKNNNYSHLAWTADARNIKGLRFYRRLGAEIIEQKKHRCLLRWEV